MTLPVETNEALVLAETHNQAYFLDLFDRILPSDYLEPLKSPGPGYEVFQALAALGERISQAVARFSVGNFIGTAAGGQKAQANVLFSRPTFTAGTVVVQANTIVTTSQGDRRFVLLADVSFGATDLGPLTGLVEAIAFGYEYNVRGERTAADGELLPGEIDTIHSLYEDPPYGDPTIVVHQVEDASGGQAEMLDQLGIDRGLLRSPAEADDPYRTRIITLPDTVSPDAIRRALDAMLDPLGIPYELIETFEITYQTCYDAPPYPIAANPNYDPNLFCYDDPRRGAHFDDVWLDDVEYRGAFVVVVPLIGAVADYGMAYDDTAMTPADLVTPGLIGGRRAVSAYDAPLTLTPIELVGAYDGTDLGAATIWKGVYDLLQKIKAAGVAAVLEQYSPVIAPTITGIDSFADPYALVAFDHFPTGNPPNGDTITLNGTGFLTVYQVDFLRTAGTNAQADAIDVAFTIISDTSIEVTALAIYTAYEAAGGLWPSEPGGPASFPIGPWKPRVTNPGGPVTAPETLNASLTEVAGPTLTWTEYSLPIFAWILMSNGSRLVAAGDGEICYSDDGGLTWTLVTGTPVYAWYSGLFDGVNFVLVGSGKCVTSPTGDIGSWTERTTGITTGNLSGLASDGSKLITCDGAGNVIASTDHGETWSALYPIVSPAESFQVMVYDGTNWIALGVGLTGPGSVCATSPTGGAGTWTARTIPSVGPELGWFLYFATGTPGVVVAGSDPLGYPNQSIVSTDHGETWSAVHDMGLLLPNSLVWTDTEYVAIGSDVTGSGRSSSSPNGTTWTPEGGTTDTMYWVVKFGDTLVSVGNHFSAVASLI